MSLKQLFKFQANGTVVSGVDEKIEQHSEKKMYAACVLVPTE